MSQVEDSRFMRRALGLARRGVGEASPNPTVGCVIVRDGEIIGEGWHAYEARDHAEIRALDAAGPRAHGATVYVTLEPCAHRGRTGPCAEALVRAGVRRVVAALVDPNTRVHGRGLERLRRAGIEVELGVCASEAQRLVEAFACHVTTGLPLVVYGCTDPKAGACDTLFQIASDPRLNHRARVIGGVLADRCAAMLGEFFARQRALGKK